MKLMRPRWRDCFHITRERWKELTRRSAASFGLSPDRLA
jgi:hypothetical protein